MFTWLINRLNREFATRDDAEQTKKRLEAAEQRCVELSNRLDRQIDEWKFGEIIQSLTQVDGERKSGYLRWQLDRIYAIEYKQVQARCRVEDPNRPGEYWHLMPGDCVAVETFGRRALTKISADYLAKYLLTDEEAKQYGELLKCNKGCAP